jgi:hypothetical protein
MSGGARVPAGNPVCLVYGPVSYRALAIGGMLMAQTPWAAIDLYASSGQAVNYRIGKEALKLADTYTS